MGYLLLRVAREVEFLALEDSSNEFIDFHFGVSRGQTCHRGFSTMPLRVQTSHELGWKGKGYPDKIIQNKKNHLH